MNPLKHLQLCGNMQTRHTVARHLIVQQNLSDICLEVHKHVSWKGPSGGSDKKTISGVRSYMGTDSEEEPSALTWLMNTVRTTRGRLGVKGPFLINSFLGQ